METSIPPVSGKENGLGPDDVNASSSPMHCPLPNQILSRKLFSLELLSPTAVKDRDCIVRCGIDAAGGPEVVWLERLYDGFGDRVSRVRAINAVARLTHAGSFYDTIRH
jgi:hypothetical protein